MNVPYVTTVHRPGLPDIHLGFAFAYQAEHASWSLRDDLTTTQNVPGTAIAWGPTPDGVTPLEPVPTHWSTYAELLTHEDHNLPAGHNFPDLYSRLKAQIGYDDAARTHSAACRWLDAGAEEVDG